MRASKFFNSTQKKLIFETIQIAERNTSGEIRVHIENHCKEDVLDRSKYLFYDLQMDNTEKNNGVLIYLAVVDKKFAIIGDEGIDKATPDDFWDSIRDNMQKNFIKGDFANGIVEAINETGKKLAEFFPYQNDDINELSDEISFYDN